MDVTSISNLIFLFALIFISIGITRADQLATPVKEIIRYIPRSLEEEQKEPVKVEKIFKSMFEQQTPWIGTFNDTNVVQRRELNKKRGIFK
jgi:predicted PurR-regulated permease PerM